MVKGRSSIQSFWTKASEGIADMKLTILDVKSLGADAAREVGTYTLKTKGSQANEILGKYVVIWQKSGGDWKLATDIWNSDKRRPNELKPSVSTDTKNGGSRPSCLAEVQQRYSTAEVRSVRPAGVHSRAVGGMSP